MLLSTVTAPVFRRRQPAFGFAFFTSRIWRETFLLISILVFSGSFGETQFIPEMVAKAQSLGTQEIRLGPTSVFWFAPASFESAYHQEAVFLVTIQFKTSFLNDAGNGIWTVYKAIIDKNLSHAMLPGLQLPGGWLQPPLTAVDQSTLLIRNLGGTMTLHGVKVIIGEQPTNLQVGGEYVVWVSFIGFPGIGLTRLTELNMGRSSVYQYKPSDDTLSAAESSAERASPVSAEIQRLTTLSHLRKRIRKLPPSKLSHR